MSDSAPKPDAPLRALAERFAESPAQVKELYQEQLRSLDRDARIKQYVPLLAARRVREILTERRRDRNADRVHSLAIERR